MNFGLLRATHWVGVYQIMVEGPSSDIRSGDFIA